VAHRPVLHVAAERVETAPRPVPSAPQSPPERPVGIGQVKGTVSGQVVKGEVAVARAKGLSSLQEHKSQVNVNPRKGPVVISVLKAELNLTKVAKRRQVFPGQEITYVLTATNVSELPVRDLVIRDKYPKELKPVRVSRYDCQDSPAESGGGVMAVSVPGELWVGQSVSFEITFRMTDAARRIVLADGVAIAIESGTAGAADN
jgi:uncharacterized repeat protein (TIGR01451 family)